MKETTAQGKSLVVSLEKTCIVLAGVFVVVSGEENKKKDFKSTLSGTELEE